MRRVLKHGQDLQRASQMAPGEGNGNPLQYSALENSMDCTVYGVNCIVYAEGVEKKGSFSTVGGNANWFRQYAEQYGDSLKN